MYESSFGLQEEPFSLTPDPRYFYLSKSHREGLAALIYGVREEKGLVTLTGPVGVGKTMILNAFLYQIQEHAVTASFSGEIAGSRVEFLKDLCRVLDISPEHESPFGLKQAIKDFAIDKRREERRVVLLVDEAQDLGPQELAHFHHLINLETPEGKLLQIVLAGTERLDERLKDEDLTALRQRVAIRCAIEPIEPEETIEYIFHRLRIAGGTSLDLFTDDALWRIVNYARGIPRLINLVCNQALLTASGSGKVPIDEEAVRGALEDVQGGAEEIPGEELVARDEISGLVELVSQRIVEEAFPGEDEEGESGEGREDSRRATEAAAAGEVTGGRIRTAVRRFISRMGPGLLLTLVGVLLLVVAGVLATLRFLNSERTIQEQEVVETTAGSLAPGLPEEKEVPGESREGFEEGEEQDSRDEESSRDETPPMVEGVTFREKDLAGIALEHYGMLDLEILRALREKNPGIQDWNHLDPTVRLVLPQVHEVTSGGADFYTIQVGAFKAEEGPYRRASELAGRGIQNLFIIQEGDADLTLVCTGVYTSGRQASGDIPVMQEWGFDDAIPTRIRHRQLADILQPYSGSLSEDPP
jgi:general secretion pathway protein A